MAKTKAPINATDNLPQTRSALRGLASLREIDCTDQADVLLSRQRSNKKPMNTAILTKTNHSAIISIMFNFRRMNMLGGILKSLVNPANLAMLAMGPGGIAAMLVKTIGSQIAMSVIQQVGEKLGLPPSIINMAQAGFAAATGQPGLAQQNMGQAIGDLAKGLNLSPMQTGQLQRDVNDTQKDISNTIKNFRLDNDESDSSGSWVMALVKALGPKLDELAGKMKTLAGQSKDSPSKANEFQAVSQEFNLLMTSLTGAIKTIGEAQATAARKG
jgi:hypothetical protein